MRNIVVTLLIILFSLSSCNFFREKGWFGKKKNDAVMAELKARQDSIRVADSLHTLVERMKQIEQARLDSIMMVEQEMAEWEARHRYHIIVGSFLTPEFAEDHKSLYRSMGYDPVIIPDSQGLFNLVAAEVHESFSRALARLERFQDTVEFQAWLFVQD
ncbi:MAG: hypothetical protein LC649_03535 [Bacteroidales bacterium]|nr:hypothetical protein [Bacteroidales bacterium]